MRAPYKSNSRRPREPPDPFLTPAAYFFRSRALRTSSSLVFRRIWPNFYPASQAEPSAPGSAWGRRQKGKWREIEGNHAKLPVGPRCQRHNASSSSSPRLTRRITALAASQPAAVASNRLRGEVTARRSYCPTLSRRYLFTALPISPSTHASRRVHTPRSSPPKPRAPPEWIQQAARRPTASAGPGSRTGRRACCTRRATHARPA